MTANVSDATAASVPALHVRNLRIGIRRRRHELVALGVGQRILQLDQPRVGAAVVAAGLGQRVDQLAVQLLGLLLLLLGLVLEGDQLLLLRLV